MVQKNKNKDVHRGEGGALGLHPDWSKCLREVWEDWKLLPNTRRKLPDIPGGV